MSFSTEIKKELSELNNLSNKEEVKYELFGYTISNNVIVKGNKIKFSTENEYNINRFAKLLRNVNINDFSIEIQGKVYSIGLKKKDLECLKLDDIDFENMKDIELMKCVTRGFFLGAGSINNPQNVYHLEIDISNEKMAKEIINKMEIFDIKIKNIGNSLYIKDGEEISKFLAFIGATKSVLRFEEVRVQRQMNNKINRLVNCKTANLNKVLNASVEQIEAIGKLKSNCNFQKLDENLKELAELRLEHPDMPLEELGKNLSIPIGKSGVNYRMKKIIQISKE